jgi:hypothetical protein
MIAILSAWLSSPLKDRIINAGIIVVLFLIILYALIKFLKPFIQRLFIEKDPSGKIKIKLRNKASAKKEFTVQEILKFQEERIKELETELFQAQKQITDYSFKEEKRKIEDEVNKNQYVPLDQHDIFFNLKRYIETGVDLQYEECNFCSEAKRDIGKAFLEQCKIPVFFKGLKEFVAQIELTCTEEDISTLLYDIPNHVYKWTAEYEAAAKDATITLPEGKILKGIPLAFLKSYEEWNTPHTNTMLTKIHTVLYSNFYKSPYLKLILILDLIDAFFLLTILDAKRTLANLNGDLDEEIKKAG